MKKVISLALTLVLIFVAVLAYSAQGVNDDNVLINWDFQSTSQDWSVVEASPTKVDLKYETAQTTALKFNNSWSYSDSWSNCLQICSGFSTLKIGQTDTLSFDVYTQKNSTATGTLQLSPVIQSPEQNYWFQLNSTNINFTSGEDVENNLLKFSFEIPLTSFDNNVLNATDTLGHLTFVFIGGTTAYSGDVYIDNIKLYTKDGSSSDNSSLTIDKINVENEFRLLKNSPITVSTLAKGGTGDYSYSHYVVKDGDIIFSKEDTLENSFTFTTLFAGNYKIISYCVDKNKTKVSSQKDINILSELPKSDKYIAITFDDGPSSNTAEILSAFKSRNAVATFFVCQNYSNIQNENMLKELVDAGFEIGNHTKTHPYLTSLTPAQIKEEIDSVNNWVYEKTGVKPTTYRPPYIDYNATVLSTLSDMAAIGCSVDSRDWMGISSDEIAQNVLNNAQDGDIVLLHDPQTNTKNAVLKIIDGLQAKGFELVTVDELFNIKGKELSGGNYYISAK